MFFCWLPTDIIICTGGWFCLLFFGPITGTGQLCEIFAQLPRPRDRLYIKSKIHHISILHHIIFPFYRHFAGFFAFRFGTVCNEIIVFDHFGPDKPFFEIGMDNTGRLRCFHTFTESPCPHFFRASSKIGLKIQ